jgi:hypothetical protein
VVQLKIMQEGNWVHKIWHGFLIFLGFWLSPLSPWNDIFTNIPLAYLFGIIFSFSIDSLFLPMVVLGYWLSNILGFILMHYGYVKIGNEEYSFRNHWKSYVLATTIYTFLIIGLIYYGILPSVNEIKEFFK